MEFSTDWLISCLPDAIPKSTSWAEVMSNSEKIKLVVLAIIELR